MKVKIAEECIGCSACCGICPEVFQMGDDGKAHPISNDDSFKEKAKEAESSCPVSVITVED